MAKSDINQARNIVCCLSPHPHPARGSTTSIWEVYLTQFMALAMNSCLPYLKSMVSLVFLVGKSEKPPSDRGL